MMQIRRSSERGTGEHGWLHAKHTFSFAEYYDPIYMGFRKLRVINEDKIEPGQGFPTHSHKNMEIITYIISGSLEHKDSIGNGSVISAGEVQIMSAGAGIQHSEFNHLQTETTHLLQIWIEPLVKGGEATYQQRNFAKNKEKFTLIVSPTGVRDSLIIKQDVKIYKASLLPTEKLTYKVEENRHVWIQIVKGNLSMGENISLNQGDGLAASDGGLLTFSTIVNECEFLVFDLP